MNVQSSIEISSSREQVWKIISDIENASHVFSDIKSIEMLNKSDPGLVGTKWKELREFMGKEATETMWITEATEPQGYTSEARNSGCLYHSSFILEEKENGVVVSKTFAAIPTTTLARLMMPLMYLLKNTLKKCIDRDLRDLKHHLEGGPS